MQQRRGAFLGTATGCGGPLGVAHCLRQWLRYLKFGGLYGMREPSEPGLHTRLSQQIGTSEGDPRKS